MFNHCFVCNAHFSPGTVVEHFPFGRRIAYDLERGRLWAICDACGGWTLAPLSDRWEALEELERLVTGRGGSRARLAGKTENVALFKVGPADIIRIGHTKLIEEAEWRYGRANPADVGTKTPNPFAPRRLSMGEWLLGNAYLIRSGLSGKHRGGQRGAMRRWVRFGELAWRGEGQCRTCGFVIRRLTFFDCRTLILKDAGGESLTPSLIRACPRCKDEVDGGLHLEGIAAEFVLRRVLAYQQDQGVPPGNLRAAAHLVEMGGGPAVLSSTLARYGRYLSALPVTSAVALRVLANDAYEQRLLGLEATSIERRWRQEEELASIIDGDLSGAPTLEAMRRKMRGL